MVFCISRSIRADTGSSRELLPLSPPFQARAAVTGAELASDAGKEGESGGAITSANSILLLTSGRSVDCIERSGSS